MMKKKDVAIGGRYAAKVSGKVVYVKITGVCVHGGWNAVNETTGKAVRIRGAGRLRYEAERREAIKAAVEKAYPASTILPDGHPTTYRDATVADFGQADVNKALQRFKVITGRNAVGPTPAWSTCPKCGGQFPPGGCPVCEAVKKDEPTGDAYLDSLPPERRAMALEARAKKAQVLATIEKQQIKRVVVETVPISPAAAPVAAEQPKQEDEVMANSKKTVVKATEKTTKAAPCGKCANCRNGAPQLCLGAPKATAASKGAKAPAKRTTPRPVAPGAKKERHGVLGIAADLLKKAGKPMGAQDIMKAILDAKLWTTSGKTPASTLYAAIIREIAVKGKEARFRRGAEKGTFEFAG